MPSKQASARRAGTGMESLRRRLQEAEEAIRAIQDGHVDAVIVRGPKGAQIFSIKSADQPYRLLVEAMSEAALILSTSGVVLHANGSFGNFIGTRVEKVVGTPLMEYAAPEDKTLLVGLVGRGAETAVSSELSFIHRDGYRLVSKVSISRMMLETAPALSVVITDLRVREENREHVAARRRLSFLAESSRLLTSTLDPMEMIDLIARLALNGIADWCAIDLRDGQGGLRRAAITHRDPQKTAWARDYVARYPQREEESVAYRALVTGKPFLVPTLSPENLPHPSTPEIEVLARELGLASAMVVPMKGRHETIGVVSFVSTDPNRAYVEADLHMAESLASHAGLALENSKYFRETQEAVQSREQFLSIASHELKTPLTGLRLQLQAALRKLQTTPDGSPARDVVPLIESAEVQGQNLVRLIDRLMDLASIRAGKLPLERERFNLEEVVHTVLTRFKRPIQHGGIAVKVRTAPTTGSWDKVRVEQILTNLVSNAIKFGGGKPLDITVEAGDGRARMIVRDYGVGMDPAFLQRIFKPFEQARTDPAFHGLGLGLYITQQIVRAHGGTIRVDSTPGVGTTFIVELPMEPESPEAPKPEPPKPEPPRVKERIRRKA